jgi:uncharacterized protein with PIN domain
MNQTLAIDTLAVSKDLKAAGFSEEQAEALTRVVSRAQDVDLTHLATREEQAAIRMEVEALRQSTKADIEALRQSTKSDAEAIRQSTRADIADLKSELLKWIIGLFGVQTIAVIGALIALTRVLAR